MDIFEHIEEHSWMRNLKAEVEEVLSGKQL